LMPASAREAVHAVVAAVREGRIEKGRIDASLRKLLAAKVRLGLHKRRLTDLEAIPDALATPEDEDLAARVAQKAVTVVRNEGGLLPLADPARACWFVLSGGRFARLGVDLVDAVHRITPRAKVTQLEPGLPASEFDALAAQAQSCDAIVIAAYALVAPTSGNVALPGGYPAFVEKLTTEGNKPVALLALGNPYLLRAFPKVQAYLATFSTATPCEIAAVRAVAGETAVEGKLPVSIPGFAKLGDGLKLAVRRPAE
jgi:beta-N-acetylhexosaminidase